MDKKPKATLDPLDLDLDLDIPLDVEGLELEPEAIVIPMSLVRDQRVPALAKIVHGVLKSYCVGKEQKCNPSLVQLAKRMEMTLPNMPRNIKNLQKAGYIKVGKVGRRNQYEFLK